jgi:hypothetical protein
MERPENPRLLRAYLADHQQLHRAGRELALRVKGRERDGDLADLMGEVARELRRQELMAGAFLRQLGAGEPHVRLRLAVLAERVGRLKPNGRLFTPSPLAPVFELEVLESLLDMSARCWAALDHAGVAEPDLLRSAIDACARLVPELERHRLALAGEALVPLGGEG